jgi:hypothetical protein
MMNSMKPAIYNALAAKVDFNPRIVHILVVALLAAILQMFLNCLCALGPIQVRCGALLDLVVIPRMLIAALIREKGRWFMAYSILLLTSFLWIPWMVEWMADWLA